MVSKLDLFVMGFWGLNIGVYSFKVDGARKVVFTCCSDFLNLKERSRFSLDIQLFYLIAQVFVKKFDFTLSTLLLPLTKQVSFTLRFIVVAHFIVYFIPLVPHRN